MEIGKEYLFICSCHSREHQFILSYDKDENEVYASVHLYKLNFWNRLKYGIKYIFGRQSRYGAFDEFILRPEDADKLIEVGNKLKSSTNK